MFWALSRVGKNSYGTISPYNQEQLLEAGTSHVAVSDFLQNGSGAHLLKKAVHFLLFCSKASDLDAFKFWCLEHPRHDAMRVTLGTQIKRQLLQRAVLQVVYEENFKRIYFAIVDGQFLKG
jgi:hypothetical protein